MLKNGKPYAEYVGKSIDTILRRGEHREALFNKSNTAPHYLIARECNKVEYYEILKFDGVEDWEQCLAVAELLFLLSFRLARTDVKG